MELLLNQNCRIFKIPSAPDKFGKITWSAFDNVKCRFVRTSKFYKNSEGNGVTITSKFQVGAKSIKAQVGSKIEFENKFYLVTDFKDWVDERGKLLATLYYCANFPTF